MTTYVHNGTQCGVSLTNVSFPEEQSDDLKRAVEHYRFESIAAFFRVCGLILIEHHRRGDSLPLPLAFNSSIQDTYASKAKKSTR